MKLDDARHSTEEYACLEDIHVFQLLAQRERQCLSNPTLATFRQLHRAPTKQQRTPTRPSLAPHDDRFAVVVMSPVAEFLELFSLIWIPRGRIAVQIYS